MNSWQENLYNKLKNFAGDNADFPQSEDPLCIAITQPEAYVLMRALEIQDRKETDG